MLKGIEQLVTSVETATLCSWVVMASSEIWKVNFAKLLSAQKQASWKNNLQDITRKGNRR